MRSVGSTGGGSAARPLDDGSNYAVDAAYACAAGVVRTVQSPAERHGVHARDGGRFVDM